MFFSENGGVKVTLHQHSSMATSSSATIDRTDRPPLKSTAFSWRWEISHPDDESSRILNVSINSYGDVQKASLNRVQRTYRRVRYENRKTHFTLQLAFFFGELGMALFCFEPKYAVHKVLQSPSHPWLKIFHSKIHLFSGLHSSNKSTLIVPKN